MNNHSTAPPVDPSSAASIEKVIADRLADLLLQTRGAITGLRATVIEQAERGLIRAALSFTEGRVGRAAEIAGMDRNVFSRKARAFGLLGEPTRGRRPRTPSPK